MQSEDLLSVNLSRLPEAGLKREITLDDSFFARLEQEEIIGGDLCVRMEAKSAAGEAFTLRFSVEGRVKVACDRCLDPLTIAVDAEDEVKLRYAEDGASDNPDFIDLDPRCASYDYSWVLYEIIETSLPLQRVHPVGECNEAMTDYILGSTGEDEEEEDAED